MKTSDYWKSRFVAMDDAEYRKTEQYIQNVKKQFNRAERTIEEKVAAWYSRLAENNEVSYAEAQKLLKEDALDDFKMDIEEYIEKGKKLGLNADYMKQLENASAKVHISRLEQIKLQMRAEVEKLYKEYESGVSAHLRATTEDIYYRTAYEMAKGTGIATTFHKLDDKTLDRFLTRPWCQDGKVFSDRIWTRKDDLINSLNTSLTQNLITGADPQKAINNIAKEFNVEKSAAGRLIMTETAALQNEARKESLKELDVEEYEIVATLDSHTSATCRAFDGRHFPLSKFEIGVNAPPFHCNCRTTTVPFFDDEFEAETTRAARDDNDEGYIKTLSINYESWASKLKSENHRIYKADPNWTYKQWHEEVVGKNCKNLIPMNLQFFAEAPKSGNVFTTNTIPKGFKMENPSTIVNLLRNDMQPWISCLSKEEKRSIKKYTSNSDNEKKNKFYKKLNAMLRGDAPYDPKLQKHAVNISDALWKCEIKRDIVCYRGTDVNIVEGSKPGAILTADQFTSTSVIKSRALDGQYHMTIYVPKGTRGVAYIEPLSGYPSQRELLLDKDTTYRVLSVQGNNIELEVVD